MAGMTEGCSVCAKQFEVQFRYQMEEKDGGFSFYCSQECHGRAMRGEDSGGVRCDACLKHFVVELVSQIVRVKGERKYACSDPCRTQILAEASGARLGSFLAPGAATTTPAPSVTAPSVTAPSVAAPSVRAPTASAPMGTGVSMGTSGFGLGFGGVSSARPLGAPSAPPRPSGFGVGSAGLSTGFAKGPGVGGGSLGGAPSTSTSSSSGAVASPASGGAVGGGTMGAGQGLSGGGMGSHSSANWEGARSFFASPSGGSPGPMAGGPSTGDGSAMRGALGYRPAMASQGAPSPSAAVTSSGEGGRTRAPVYGPRRIAIFNHKGGTGKTTTSVSIAAGLALRGLRVLLVDTDAQGNVGVSLGVKAERSLYHVLVMGLKAQDATINVRPNLDLIVSNETLAAAELYLAGRQNRDRVLRERLGPISEAYDIVLLDCSPSLSLMNQNALVHAEGIIVPVACDFLSLVGVRQVIKTVKNVNSLLHHPVQISGVLPTFYDARARICRDAVDTLREHFGERCLPPVRSTIKVKEAPAQGRTIFEYAADTNAADDYRRVVDFIVEGPSALRSVSIPSSSSDDFDVQMASA